MVNIYAGHTSCNVLVVDITFRKSPLHEEHYLSFIQDISRKVVKLLEKLRYVLMVFKGVDASINFCF